MNGDAHDPLPESNWLYRRVFVFLVTIAILWMISRYGDRLSDIAAVAVQNDNPEVVVSTVRALLSLMFWLLSGLFLMITFYMLAPSAEQVIKALQVAKSLREGVIFSGARKLETEGRTETASTATGKPIDPPATAPAPPAVTPPALPATEMME